MNKVLFLLILFLFNNAYADPMCVGFGVEEMTKGSDFVVVIKVTESEFDEGSISKKIRFWEHITGHNYKVKGDVLSVLKGKEFRGEFSVNISMPGFSYLPQRQTRTGEKVILFLKKEGEKLVMNDKYKRCDSYFSTETESGFRSRVERILVIQGK